MFKVLARILAEEPSRPRVMTDRLKDLFSEDTSQQNEEYRAHVDTLIFSYYALLQQVGRSGDAWQWHWGGGGVARPCYCNSLLLWACGWLLSICRSSKACCC